jgi:tRNA threonylcarbamoyl adenosine modification protein YeaZ
MKLLAWDTSSKAGALVAMEWTPGDSSPQLVTELSLNVDLTHSERLLWGVHQVLESARWSLKEIDLLGVGVGPGSFTGLRIGVTTARTLAHSLKKPLIGVSSLAALARPLSLQRSRKLMGSESKTLIIVATDACKGDLFALWGWADSVMECAVVPGESSGLGVWKKGVTEAVLPGEELIERVLADLSRHKRSVVRWAVVGEAKGRYSEFWKKLPARQRLVLPDSYRWLDQVQGRYLGLLVFEASQSLDLENSPLQVMPRYLRASEAERKLKAGVLKSLKLRESV